MENFSNRSMEVANDWTAEAESIIDDVKQFVKEIKASSLPCDSSRVYLNVKTLEDKSFTVELSAHGFQLVSKSRYDSCSEPDGTFFETSYSLLDHISPGYRAAFSDAVIEQLQKVKN